MKRQDVTVVSAHHTSLPVLLSQLRLMYGTSIYTQYILYMYTVGKVSMDFVVYVTDDAFVNLYVT